MSDKPSVPLRFDTVLLWHETAAGNHHDWLFVDPTTLDQPEAPLTTYRIAAPPDQWLELGRMELTPIPPHRRIYLTYEGPISGNRGSVKRIDEGTFVPVLWTPQKKVIDLKLRRFQGVVSIEADATGTAYAMVVNAER